MYNISTFLLSNKDNFQELTAEKTLEVNCKPYFLSNVIDMIFA